VSPSRRYRVEFADDLGGGWANLAEFTTDAAQRLATVESNAPLGQSRFYRIRLVE